MTFQRFDDLDQPVVEKVQTSNMDGYSHYYLLKIQS